MSERRFAFGKNWQRYLRSIGDNEISAAKQSLAASLNNIVPARSSFLDIGSGSGLFSRAAYELGFAHVVSFDYDNDSVAATRAMHEAAKADGRWKVLQGSVLDDSFMTPLGEHDFVYAWGVLHHTGDLPRALELAAQAVRPGGVFFIALYNDQGWISSYWKLVKSTYVRLPRFLQAVMVLVFSIYFGVGLFVADLLRGRNPIHRHTGDRRGMKFLTDVVDWIGGYPFEVATPQQVREMLPQQKFVLKWQRLVGRRHGCNEFVFQRSETW